MIYQYQSQGYYTKRLVSVQLDWLHLLHSQRGSLRLLRGKTVTFPWINFMSHFRAERRFQGYVCARGNYSATSHPIASRTWLLRLRHGHERERLIM